jgi:transposase-like protein
MRQHARKSYAAEHVVSSARDLMVTSDRAPGIIKAIEICFPRAARQRCLAHRMRNLAAKVPEDVWPEFKVRAQAAYQAPSRAIARACGRGRCRLWPQVHGGN